MLLIPQSNSIADTEMCLANAKIIIANKDSSSPELVMEAIASKFMLTNKLAEQLAHREAVMASIPTRKNTVRKTVLSEDAKLVAKAIGASTTKVVKATIYQGGLCSPR